MAFPKKTICLHGHPLTPENVRYQRGHGRVCKTCANQRKLKCRKAQRQREIERLRNAALARPLAIDIERILGRKVGKYLMAKSAICGLCFKPWPLQVMAIVEGGLVCESCAPTWTIQPMESFAPQLDMDVVIDGLAVQMA